MEGAGRPDKSLARVAHGKCGSRDGVSRLRVGHGAGVGRRRRATSFDVRAADQSVQKKSNSSVYRLARIKLEEHCFADAREQSATADRSLEF